MTPHKKTLLALCLILPLLAACQTQTPTESEIPRELAQMHRRELQNMQAMTIIGNQRREMLEIMHRDAIQKETLHKMGIKP